MSNTTTALVKVGDTSPLLQRSPERGELAYRNYAEIIQRKNEAARNLLELGRLFKECRDNKFYTAFDCKSFEEFIAMPDICFARSTVFSFIHIYEIYIEKFAIDKDLLVDIGHKKLQVINPVVLRNAEMAEDWLFKAKELSYNDLKNEVRIYQGLAPLVPIKRRYDELYPFDFNSYRDFVIAHNCVVCGTPGPSDPAHLPKTVGSGAPPEWIVPLCRPCHDECHRDPIDFLVLYRNKVFAYLYTVVTHAYAILAAVKGRQA